jgi:hypothetical protein
MGLFSVSGCPARPGGRAGLGLAGQKLGHDRRGGVRVDVMSLARKDGELPARQGGRGCLRGRPKERRALFPGDYQS